MEPAEKVVSSERSWLVVRVGRQGLDLLGGDSGVTFGELGYHATNNPRTMGKGVESNSSKSCTVQSTFTCEDCALHYSTVFHCFIRVDGPVRILAVEDSWIMDCTLGIQVEPPTSTKLYTFFCSIPCLAGTSPQGPWNYGSSPCKAPRSVLATTSTSSRCPRKASQSQ